MRLNAIFAFAAALLFALPAAAQVTLPGTGQSIGTITCGSDKCAKNTPVDSGGTTATETVNHSVKVTAQPGTSTIGDVGQASFEAVCTFNGAGTLTLPGTGGTYAAPASSIVFGDISTNTAKDPGVCTVARVSGGPFTITEAIVTTSNTTVTNGLLRLHIYKSSPTFTNANDGVYLTALSGHFCTIEITLDNVFSDGAYGRGAPLTSNTCTAKAVATDVYVGIEFRAAYAWAAAQTYTVTLKGFQ